MSGNTLKHILEIHVKVFSRIKIKGKMNYLHKLWHVLGQKSN